jgi:type IV pilus assembly protein PilC
MKYKYRGYDWRAKKVYGEIEAPSPAAARNDLRNRNIRAAKLFEVRMPTPKKERAQGGASPGGVNSRDSKEISVRSFLDLLGGNRVPKNMEFTAFIRQLAVMQEAGIPIVQSLAILGDASETKGFGRVLLEIKLKVEEGLAFNEALREYTDVFDRIFVNLVSAGEVSGSLDRILNRLAVYYEKSSGLRRKIIAAMTYPTLMLVMMIAVVTVMLFFVVPQFSTMFSSNGKKLPYATQVIIDISNLLKEFWYLYVGGLFGTIGGAVFILRSPEARKIVDPYIIHLPLFGDLIRKISIARFARTFGTMIQSGVPILEALDITGAVAGNYAVERALKETRQSISQGNSISGPLTRAGVFPKMAISMIAIGEQTGALDQMLQKVADFYEEEVDAKVSALTSVIEPIMIIVVGITVAGILIPMYLPVFQMGDIMSDKSGGGGG